MKTSSELPPYGGVAWTSEWRDCALPVRIDTFNQCSFMCLYCFSLNFRFLGHRDQAIRRVRRLKAISPHSIYNQLYGEKGTFRWYTDAGLAIQWGGLGDPFDQLEHKYGIGLELMRMLRQRGQQISFSTKGTWWTQDERYMELFRANPDWHVKISIIVNNENLAAALERGVPSVKERFAAMERLAKAGVWTTLRLRPLFPFWRQDAIELLRRAADAGGKSVSCETFCLSRNKLSMRFLEILSHDVGINVSDFYRRNRATSLGYERLRREVILDLFLELQAKANEYGLRFHSSDTAFKDFCPEGPASWCCCGVPPHFRPWPGTMVRAIQTARLCGAVSFADHYDDVPGMNLRPINLPSNWGDLETSTKIQSLTLRQVRLMEWLSPTSGHNPWRVYQRIVEVKPNAPENPILEWSGQ